MSSITPLKLGLPTLNVGCGLHPIVVNSSWVNLDRHRPSNWYATTDSHFEQFDLEDCDKGYMLPFKNNAFQQFYLSHILEHLNSPLPIMQELHRVAAPNARMIVRLPYGSTDNAWEDPTHVRPYFLQSPSYFSQQAYLNADYNYRGDWQTIRKVLVVNAKFTGIEHEELLELFYRGRNVIDEFIFEMVAVKPIRLPKACNDKSTVEFVFYPPQLIEQEA